MSIAEPAEQVNELQSEDDFIQSHVFSIFKEEETGIGNETIEIILVS